MDRLRFTISTPPRELSPNARTHWAARHRARRLWQGTVCSAIWAAMGHSPPPRWSRAYVYYTFVFALQRRRDLDNLCSAMKHAQDCLQVCGVVLDDSGCVPSSPTIEVRPGIPSPYVEVEVSPTGDVNGQRLHHSRD